MMSRLCVIDSPACWGDPGRPATARTNSGGTMTENTRPTLVLGGTGKTGRRVVERLTARGLPVRVGSRSGGAPRFDWEDRSTWAPALDGAGAAYIALPRPRRPRRGRG